MNTPSDDDDVITQPGGSHAVIELLDPVDSLPGVLPDGVSFGESNSDSAGVDGLRQAGVVKRGRGRPRKLVDRLGGGNSSDSKEDAGRKSSEIWSGWLDEVKEHLDSKDGLTDGILPVKLAKAVVKRAEVSLMVSPLDVVQALEKCENMALKLKAAKFLKDTSKGTIEELRKYALGLMNEEAPDETTG